MYLCQKQKDAVENNFPVICTNACPEFYRCEHPKIPFLIHSTNSMCTGPEPDEDELHIAVFQTFETHPDAYINDIVNHDRNSIDLLRKPGL